MQTFKKTNISPELKAFFKEVQEWIDTGFLRNQYIDSDWGLCANLCVFAEDCYYSGELLELFKLNNLNSEYPFNGGFAENYYKEKEHYTNPMRLAFIKFYSE